MAELPNWLPFLLASIGLTLLPGPDNLFVMSIASVQGAQKGVAIALGMASGNFLHTLAVALGLSALVIQTPALFTLIKGLGIAYLLNLAYQSWQPPNHIDLAKASTPAKNSSLSLFKRGVLMNVLNPKVSLFFIAFLPQFLGQNSAHPMADILLLGTIFVIQAAIIFSLIALLAGQLSPAIQGTSPILIARISSGIYLALAAYLALVYALPYTQH